MTSLVGNAFFGLVEVGLLALCALKIQAIKKDVKEIISKDANSLESAPIINMTHFFSKFPDGINGGKFWSYMEPPKINVSGWEFKATFEVMPPTEDSQFYYKITGWEVWNTDSVFTQKIIYTEDQWLQDRKGKRHVIWEGMPQVPWDYYQANF